MNHRRTLIWAAKVAAPGETAGPSNAHSVEPRAILVEDSRIIATGRPEDIGQPADAALDDRRHWVVMPALVNAHTHLDLSHIGPIGYDGSFANWVAVVRRERAREDAAIANSVELGVQLSRAGGHAAVGDIAGGRSLAPVKTLRQAGLAGVSFLEVFGIGRTQADTGTYLQRIAGEVEPLERGVRFGLQPHAPYSCGPDVYRAAGELGLPVSTHMAETTDELEFVANAAGPLRHMLQSIGVWDDSIAGSGRHPLETFAHVLEQRHWVVAHVNYVHSAHMETLARWPVSVAYCPRASAYFGHVNHRYRDMLAAGVNVALGTDSLLCLDTPSRISVLDEMRLLHRRDGVEGATLIRMATLNGAKALGLEPNLFTLKPGPCAGIIGVEIDNSSSIDPLTQALRNDSPPQWILGPVRGEDSWFTK